MTDRETAGTRFATFGASLLEGGVYGESEYGRAVYASDASATLFQAILDVISSGGFPRQRQRLTDQQRHQLRDAMILEAHVREGRDVFVSDDRKAFVNFGRRDELESLCATRIMTSEEFCSWMSEDARE